MSRQNPDTSYREWIGRVINDRYRILDLLGEGGMGAVFVAEHLGLRKEVAFKVVRSELAGNADLAERFAREAMVTSSIDHVNVTSAMDFGTLPDGGAYLVTQLVHGKSLTETLVAEGTLHWSRAADLGAQIADALAAAQSHGIVHRDLKPDNILIHRRESGTERVKILDFGIAKYSRDSLAPPPLRGAPKLTGVGSVVGTPGYMAPEQAMGQKAGHQADLYSLGVLIWECITGKRLWQGEDVAEIVRNQLNQQPPPLREVTGDRTIPEGLQELVARLLTIEPGARPTDAASVRDILRVVADAARIEPTAERLLLTGPGVETGAVDDTTAAAGGVENTLKLPAEPSPESPPDAGGQTPNTVVPVETGAVQPPRLSRRSQAMLGSAALAVLVAGGLLVLAGQLEVRPKGKLDKLARSVVPAGKDERKAPAGGGSPYEDETPIPESLRAELDSFVRGETRSDRVAAAEALLRHVPEEEVPVHLRAIAYLQIAETCWEKKSELDKIELLDDPLVLPYLLLLSDRKKMDCGPRRDEDCLGCLREQLEALISRLEERRLSDEAAE